MDNDRVEKVITVENLGRLLNMVIRWSKTVIGG